MSTPFPKNPPTVLLVGGGIGGMAAALALARLGVSIDLLEQSATIGEIGAGLQLGPNAFAALDALGVGEAVRRNAVFTDRLVMMDAVDCGEVASVPVGEAFRARFRNPYAVSHRADLHGAIHEAVKQHPLIRFQTSAQVESLDFGTGGTKGVVATTRDGRRFKADAIVGCDGVKSVVRARLVGDEARVSGHVVYRAVVPVADMPADLRWNAPVVWAGPNCHLVHYRCAMASNTTWSSPSTAASRRSGAFPKAARKKCFRTSRACMRARASCSTGPARGGAGARPTAIRWRAGATARPRCWAMPRIR
jgi:2-polyprenyl-6-methoxyphenol hydroxylase-like FAD-dependent oxidoreductase